MLKSAHFPSVYWGKFIFLYRESVQIFKGPFFAKVTVGLILTIEGEKSGKSEQMSKNKKWLCYAKVTQKSDLFRA